MASFELLIQNFSVTNVSPPDKEEKEQFQRMQAWIQGYLQAVQDLQTL